MIWAAILLAGAGYGYTLLGTENAFFGVLLIGFALLKWRDIIEGFSRSVWFFTAVTIILLATWATSEGSNPNVYKTFSEALHSLRYLLIFPALLLLGVLVAFRAPIYRIFRRLKYRFLNRF